MATFKVSVNEAAFLMYVAAVVDDYDLFDECVATVESGEDGEVFIPDGAEDEVREMVMLHTDFDRSKGSVETLFNKLVEE